MSMTNNDLARDRAFSRQEIDAARGNDQVAKAAFIREEIQQTGCLAIEAAERWEALKDDPSDD